MSNRPDAGGPLSPGLPQRALFDSRHTDNMVTSGSPTGSSVVGEGLVGFILLSSDRVVHPGSKARTGMIVDS